MRFSMSSIKPAVYRSASHLAMALAARPGRHQGRRRRALSPPIDRGGGWAAWLRKQEVSCVFRQCLKPPQGDDTGCGATLIG